MQLRVTEAVHLLVGAVLHPGDRAVDATTGNGHPSRSHPGIGAIMFKLGYLPGGADRTTMTRPNSTAAAIDAALGLLRRDGIVSVVCCSGHDGGPEETQAVMDLSASLDRKRFAVSTYRRETGVNETPIAVFIQNRS